MWVGTGNGVVLSIPLVAAQPESSRSVVTTPTDNGGPGGVVRVYTDTLEKGEDKTSVSSFMPYCSMVSTLYYLRRCMKNFAPCFCGLFSENKPTSVVVPTDEIVHTRTNNSFITMLVQVNAHISFHGHRDSVKFFVTVPGSMDKPSSVPSPKLSTSSMKAESSLFTSITDDEEKCWLVISGGEGYIDFRTGDNIEGGENIGGSEDIPSSSKMSSAENSHVMVWQVTGD
jgi:mannose-6-phosphate isomerase-like protein (cupin superfamily)